MEDVMSNRIAWMSLALALLATVMTTQYMRVSAGIRAPETTTSIDPHEITQKAGELPVIEVAIPY
jgi:hypothetical protein